MSITTDRHWTDLPGDLFQVWLYELTGGQVPTLSERDARALEHRCYEMAEMTAMVSMADDLPDLASLLVRPRWHARAACRGVGADQFFVERGGDQRPGKALCAGCAVQGPCLAQGLAGHEKGLWGGSSEQERRRRVSAHRSPT